MFFFFSSKLTLQMLAVNCESGQPGNALETDFRFGNKNIRDLPRLTAKRRNMNREPVRYWTEEEHRLFLVGVQKFGGRNYKALSEHIKTRTPTQVRTHLQKYLLKLQVAFDTFLKLSFKPLANMFGNCSEGQATQDRCKPAVFSFSE